MSTPRPSQVTTANDTVIVKLLRIGVFRAALL
jgi:hypothetical protein